MNAHIDEVVKFFQDLINVLNGFFTAIATDSALGAISTMLPEAIHRVLVHPDFDLMYSVMIPVGVAMAVLYTSLDILEKTSMGREITLEQIILTMVKLIAAVAFIQNGKVVFEGLNAVSEYIVEQMQLYLGAVDDKMFKNAVTPITNDAAAVPQGIFRLLGIMISLCNISDVMGLLQQWGAILFYLVFIPFAAYQRAVKVGYYCLAAPLVFADTAGKGLRHSNGVKYTIQLLKVFLEYPVIYLGVYCAMQIRAHDTTINGLAFIVIICTCLFKSKDYVKSLMA